MIVFLRAPIAVYSRDILGPSSDSYNVHNVMTYTLASTTSFP